MNCIFLKYDQHRLCKLYINIDTVLTCVSNQPSFTDSALSGVEKEVWNSANTFGYEIL